MKISDNSYEIIGTAIEDVLVMDKINLEDYFDICNSIADALAKHDPAFMRGEFLNVCGAGYAHGLLWDEAGKELAY